MAGKKTLDAHHLQIDRHNPKNPINSRVLRRFIGTANWAFAVARELSRFLGLFNAGVNNPLYVDFIFRLEEIYTKCFAAAHMFGDVDESLVGLHGLLIDFELTEPVWKGPCVTNYRGIQMSEESYYVAYVGTTEREPLVYERYGELIQEMFNLISTKYPDASFHFGMLLKYRLTDIKRGFGDISISSPAKIEMREKVWELSRKLIAHNKA